MRKHLVIWVLLALIPTTAAYSQEPWQPVVVSHPPELTVAERQELKSWLADMRKWQKKDRAWHQTFDHSMRMKSHRMAPDEPVWLRGFCPAAPSWQEDLKQACDLIAAMDLDPVVENIRQRILVQRSAGEKVMKNSFFTRLHFDVLGSQTMFGNGAYVFGLGGVHISLVDVGRVQFYGPPGAMLVILPNDRGGHQVRPAYDWGMSVRMGDFHFPHPGSRGKNATVFLNMTKCWISGTTVAGINPSSMDFITVSISPRRK
ncbi:MAG: hypothetical protein KW802_04250 [Candidatus Doudnabacteria bacterium]|nr:hypothetical protein [Candidatus Doudnabacteria bacterium]